MHLSNSLLECRGLEVWALKSILACAKTMIPMGGPQPTNESSKETKAGPVPGDVKLLWGATADPCWHYPNICRSPLQPKGCFLSFLPSPLLGEIRWHSQLLLLPAPNFSSEQISYMSKLIVAFAFEQLDKHNYIPGFFRKLREILLITMNGGLQGGDPYWYSWI